MLNTVRTRFREPKSMMTVLVGRLVVAQSSGRKTGTTYERAIADARVSTRHLGTSISVNALVVQALLGKDLGSQYSCKADRTIPLNFQWLLTNLVKAPKWVSPSGMSNTAMSRLVEYPKREWEKKKGTNDRKEGNKQCTHRSVKLSSRVAAIVLLEATRMITKTAKSWPTS